MAYRMPEAVARRTVVANDRTPQKLWWFIAAAVFHTCR
jgi:hypothetical protein